MTDSMVTGRMSAAKKAAGNRVLEKIGVTASQAINQLYDHLITQGELPFLKEDEKVMKKTISPKQLAEANEFVQSIRIEGPFSEMTDAQIKNRKIKDKYGITIPE